MNASGITPLGDRCIVQIVAEEKTTKGGIILLDETVDKNEAAKAEAILLESGEAVGQVTKVWPPDGSHVLIGKYAGVSYQPGGPDSPLYRLVNWDDIYGWLEEKGDKK